MPNITKSALKEMGWVEKSGWMVRFGNPRIGWKDGRLVIGYHEHPEKVFDMEGLKEIIDEA